MPRGAGKSAARRRRSPRAAEAASRLEARLPQNPPRVTQIAARGAFLFKVRDNPREGGAVDRCDGVLHVLVPHRQNEPRGQRRLLQEIFEPGGMTVVTLVQQFAELIDAAVARFREIVTQLVQMPRELRLQIARQDRMRDRPGDDREVLRPPPGGRETGEPRREGLEPVADGVAAAISAPLGNFRRERHPVFVAVIGVTDLRRDDDPEQPVSFDEMPRRHEFVAQGAPDGVDLGAFEAVLDRVDRKAVRKTLARQGVEMPFQPGLRFKQHAFRLKFVTRPWIFSLRPGRRPR